MSTKQETKAKKAPVTNPSVTLEWETDPSEDAKIELIGGLNIIGPNRCAEVDVNPRQGVEDVAEAIRGALDAGRNHGPCNYGQVTRNGNGVKVRDPSGKLYFMVRETINGVTHPDIRIPECGQKLLLECGMKVCARKGS